MRCQDALKAMHEALDGQALDPRIAELGAHTRACASCARAYAELVHWDQVLREPDADEPGDAYFHVMAGEIARAVGTEQPKPAPVRALSWSFASAMAAACLVLGLGIGHFALPRTITETQTVVKRVPGPVREIEKVVTKPVRVPVEVPVEVVRWRTRTVTKVERVPAEPPSLGVTYATAPPSPASHVADVAAVPIQVPSLPAQPSPPERTARGTYFATLYTGPGGLGGDRGLTHEESSALARRLSDDMGRLDEALSTRRLASTLVSDIETVDAEIERAITSADAAAASQ